MSELEHWALHAIRNLRPGGQPGEQPDCVRPYLRMLKNQGLAEVTRHRSRLPGRWVYRWSLTAKGSAALEEASHSA
jgi:predicted ArsR family transcriptional regulator